MTNSRKIKELNMFEVVVTNGIPGRPGGSDQDNPLGVPQFTTICSSVQKGVEARTLHAENESAARVIAAIEYQRDNDLQLNSS